MYYGFCKIIVAVFWDCQEILLIDYIPKGQTTTGYYYADLITKVREAIKEKHRAKLSLGVLFLHGNALTHQSEVALKALRSAKKHIIYNFGAYA